MAQVMHSLVASSQVSRRARAWSGVWTWDSGLRLSVCASLVLRKFFRLREAFLDSVDDDHSFPYPAKTYTPSS